VLLEVEDPEAFVADPIVQTAMTNTMASVAGMPAEWVSVTLSVISRRRLGVGRKLQTGNVQADYIVSIPQDFAAVHGSVQDISSALGSTAPDTLAAMLTATITSLGGATTHSFSVASVGTPTITGGPTVTMTVPEVPALGALPFDDTTFAAGPVPIVILVLLGSLGLMCTFAIITWRVRKRLNEQRSQRLLEQSEKEAARLEEGGASKAKPEKSQDPSYKIYYLPKYLSGVAIMKDEGNGMWKADKSRLEAESYQDKTGVGYRNSMDLDDKAVDIIPLKWGGTVPGESAGPDWIKCYVKGQGRDFLEENEGLNLQDDAANLIARFNPEDDSAVLESDDRFTPNEDSVAIETDAHCGSDVPGVSRVLDSYTAPRPGASYQPAVTHLSPRPDMLSGYPGDDPDDPRMPALCCPAIPEDVSPHGAMCIDDVIYGDTSLVDAAILAEVEQALAPTDNVEEVSIDSRLWGGSRADSDEVSIEDLNPEGPATFRRPCRTSGPPLLSRTSRTSKPSSSSGNARIPPPVGILTWEL
jgi:hypothetical protein